MEVGEMLDWSRWQFGRHEELYKNNESVRLWLDRYPNPRTIRSYIDRLAKFCKYTNQSPEQFIKERQTAFDEHKRAEMAKSDSKIFGFYNWLLRGGAGKKYSPWSAMNAYTAIRAFCEANGVPVGKTPAAIQKNKQNKFESNYYPSLDEIEKMVDVASPWRDKALIATLKDSGARVGLLSLLKVKDVEPYLKEEWILRTLNFDLDERGFVGSKGANVFVCGPEACYYIGKMLEQRREWGEPLNDDSWLFRSYGKAKPKIAERTEKGRIKAIKIATNTPSRPLTPRQMEKRVVKIGQKAGVIKEPEKKYARVKIHAHSFRKFFYNRMIAARMLDIHREYLMNHSIDPTKKAYFDASFEGKQEILRAYQEAYPYVSIKTPAKSLKEMEDKIAILERENRALKQRLNGSVLSSDQVAELLRRIEKLEKEAKG